jgi:transcriptional regulator with XRE-family HTH domain
MTTHQQQSAFGQRLARLRRRQRLTQAGLARRAGLSVAVVQALK